MAYILIFFLSISAFGDEFSDFLDTVRKTSFINEDYGSIHKFEEYIKGNISLLNTPERIIQFNKVYLNEISVKSSIQAKLQERLIYMYAAEENTEQFQRVFNGDVFAHYMSCLNFDYLEKRDHLFNYVRGPLVDYLNGSAKKNHEDKVVFMGRAKVEQNSASWKEFLRAVNNFENINFMQWQIKNYSFAYGNYFSNESNEGFWQLMKSSQELELAIEKEIRLSYNSKLNSFNFSIDQFIALFDHDQFYAWDLIKIYEDNHHIVKKMNPEQFSRLGVLLERVQWDSQKTLNGDGLSKEIKKRVLVKNQEFVTKVINDFFLFDEAPTLEQVIRLKRRMNVGDIESQKLILKLSSDLQKNTDFNYFKFFNAHSAFDESSKKFKAYREFAAKSYHRRLFFSELLGLLEPEKSVPKELIRDIENYIRLVGKGSSVHKDIVFMYMNFIALFPEDVKSEDLIPKRWRNHLFSFLGTNYSELLAEVENNPRRPMCGEYLSE